MLIFGLCTWLSKCKEVETKDKNIPVIPFPFGTYITIHDNLTFEVPHWERLMKVTSFYDGTIYILPKTSPTTNNGWTTAEMLHIYLNVLCIDH